MKTRVVVIVGGELKANGTVILFDDSRDLPGYCCYIALYYYRDLDESSIDFEQGQGEVDSFSGTYSATIPVTDGKKKSRSGLSSAPWCWMGRIR